MKRRRSRPALTFVETPAMTRVRFAPSPTGNLHIGGARTALFNWLQARHDGGKFLLRVEDTDLERSTQQSIDAIYEALDWLGLDFDEAPVLQTSRQDEHVRLANELLAQGLAYKCYCTAEELDRMREEAIARGDQPRYDRRWRDATEAPSPDAPYSVRFKMPLDGEATVDDLVLGPVTVGNQELDDLIILRSDGTPTYNFVVVCDDAFMQVTHVIRGQDHLRNTFRQVPIYQALGFNVPRFGHLPLVDGLSKRKGSASVQAYRDMGFLKEAVINYIARLGWSHGDQEIFSIDELVQHFDVTDVNRGSAAFDEKKMRWVNVEWIRRLSADDLATRLSPHLVRRGFSPTVDARMCFLVDQLRERAETLEEMADAARFAYEAPTAYDEEASAKWLGEDNKAGVQLLTERFSALTSWDVETLNATIKETIKESGLKMPKLAQPLRIALTGSTSSPSIAETAFIVGQAESVARLQRLIANFPG